MTEHHEGGAPARLVPFNFDYPFTPERVAFATRTDGTAVTLTADPGPVTMYGSAGSGKSAAAQALITGALLAGCDVYLADTVKAAQDFEYVRPWLRGFATHPSEVLKMVEGLCVEMRRRNALNAAYEVTNIGDLPEGVRPAQTWLFVDEFFGMICKFRPNPAPGTGPDFEAARQKQLVDYETASRFVSLVDELVAGGRSAGIRLVVAAQKLTATMLDSTAAGPGGLAGLKSAASVLLLGRTQFGQRVSAFRDWESVPDLGGDVPRGRGVFEPAVGPAEVVQVWWAHCDEYVEQLRARLPQG